MEADMIASVVSELHELNENIKSLERTIYNKLGGLDEDNLNVTLFTDKPIMITDKEEK